MREWISRNIVLIVVFDLVVSLTVFFLFGYLAIGQNRLNNRADCWFGVLDRAVSHHHAPLTPAQRNQLTQLAGGCVQLPR